MSSICVPKRIYDAESLESWSNKIKNSWEAFFTKQELSLGREIYRNGEIKEIELNFNDVIVHAKFDQEECYALIDWERGVFKVRGSSEDKVLSRSLAVAGLYEIEQIINEEAISEKTETKVIYQKNVPIRQKTAQIKITSETQDEARNLVLEFAIEEGGLQYKAFWHKDTFEPVLALKSESYTPGDTNAYERERLISLASLSRRSGFKFNSKNGYYWMSDIPKIKVFLEKEMDKWRQLFEIDLDLGSERLNNGIQEVEIVVDLDAYDNGTLDFCWNMRVEDEVLSSAQALKLIKKSGTPLILPKIGMVILSKEKLNILATWKRWLDLYPDGKIPRYLIFSLFGEDPIKLLLSKELVKWKESLFALPKSNIGSLPPVLRDYQKQGVKWLWHLCEKNCHGLLADEMGLGKTLQALSFITLRSIYDKPDLIVCPASVVPVWIAEIERFFPHLKVNVLKSGNDFYKCNEKIVWIASYTQLRMHTFLLEQTDFGYVILDEAQLIKNPEAKVSQACMCIRAQHRIVLTGTPLENRYLDLWTLFRFLMPGLLGTRKYFEEQISSEGVDIRNKLRKQIAPFVLRRTKQDVLKELPDKTESDIVCPLTSLQREEYQRLSVDGVRELGEDIPTAVREHSLSFLTLLTRLRQVCCDPGLLPWMEVPLKESGKIMVLMEKLSEVLANGHKVVVFSQFVSLLSRVCKALEDNFDGVPVYQLTGKTVDRAKPVEKFQSLDGPGVILVSLRAGGTGINLSNAGYVFLLDPWWNPAVEEQAIDRVHRLGQNKAVFVYRMITAGTIESRIQKLKIEKKGIFSGVLGEMSDISDLKNYYNTLSELIALLPEEK